jgi:hypothetical protein
MSVGEELHVSTVLVQNEDQVRYLMLSQLRASAGALYDVLGDVTGFGARGVNSQRSRTLLHKAERLVAEIATCEELLGQIGWRKKARRH